MKLAGMFFSMVNFTGVKCLLKNLQLGVFLFQVNFVFECNIHKEMYTNHGCQKVSTPM